MKQILLTHGFHEETYCYYEVEEKYESNDSLKWWWHSFLRCCPSNLVRRYINVLYLYNLSRLRTTNVKSNNKIVSHENRQEADNIPQKDLMLLTNTPAQAESLLCSLLQTAGDKLRHECQYISCVLNKSQLHFKWQASKIRPNYLL